MRVLLFGGTTEGRLLAEALAGKGVAVTVCVATELGAEELRTIPDLEVQTGRLSEEEIRAILPGYDLCVDATHPYARLVSQSVRAACGAEGIPLRRVLRETGEFPGERTVPTPEAAAAYLSEKKEGNILLTTGTKDLEVFSSLDPERLYVRILPTHEGLSACERLGIPHRNILAMQGPFSVELNEAVLRQYRIRWMVTKDGGKAGGFEEKLEAAHRAGTEAIVIARPREDGVTMEEFLQEWSHWETAEKPSSENNESAYRAFFGKKVNL